MEDRTLSKVVKGVYYLVLVLILCAGVFLPLILTADNNGNEIVAETMIVKAGASGSVVKSIQTKLNEKGYSVGSVDGIFGSKTTSAVKKFQSANGLKVDGIVGDKTAKALGVNLQNSSGNSGYSGTEIYLLAKCIYAEARGEAYIGQVAVGSVVLNRVKSSSFPNSISGVIYQPWAFTAVHDGQINLEPNDSAKRAARDAMNGWDPTNGCIYYYNPAKTTNKWIWSRPVQLVIGKHNFAI